MPALLTATEADDVLSQARRQASELLKPDRFRLLGGQRFLEIAPLDINKAMTVDYVSIGLPGPARCPFTSATTTKTKKTFAAIKTHHGLSIIVSAQPRPTLADSRLDSPASVRRWLNEIVAALNRRGPITSNG